MYTNRKRKENEKDWRRLKCGVTGEVKLDK